MKNLEFSKFEDEQKLITDLNKLYSEEALFTTDLEIYKLYYEFLDSIWSKSEKCSAFVLKLICENTLRKEKNWIIKNSYAELSVSYKNIITDICQKEYCRIKNSFSNYYLGVIKHISNEDAESLQHFANASSDMEGKQLMFEDEHGMLHLKPMKELDYNFVNTASPLGFEPSWSNTGSSNIPNDSKVIAVFFDHVYFMAFSANFLKSVVRENKSTENIVIHFHITNPGEELVQVVDSLHKIIDGQDNLFLSISVDKNTVKDRAYFTCTRFLGIPFLLEKFDSVLVADADSELIDCPSKLFAEFDNVHASFLVSRGPWGYKPWRRVWAGFCYFTKNEECKLYLDNFKQVLLYLWIENKSNWWIDQNALYYAMRLTQNSCPGFLLKNLDGISDKYISSSEELKLRLLTKNTKMKELMDKGLNWNQALREIQL